MATRLTNVRVPVVQMTPAAWPIGFALGLSFVVPTYASILTQHDYVTAASITVFVPIILWLVMVAMGNGVRLQRGLLLAGAILLPLLTSMLVHIPDYGMNELLRSVVRVSGCSLFVLVATFVALHPRRDDVTRMALGIAALALALLFIGMMLLEPVNKWGRHMPGGLSPNMWGELCIVMTVGAALARPRWIFYGALPFIFIGLFLLQSRGALIATVILATFAILAREGFRRLVLIGLVAVFLGIPIVIAVDMLAFRGGFSSGIIDFVANDVLRLNDPRRGLGTGFTGRVDGYLVAWSAFTQNPLLGVGFGLGNEITLEENAGTIHNGHLQLLLELGLLLYPFIFIVMVGALLRSLILRCWLVSGMLLAFFFFIVFSPRSINISALSMVSWFMIVYAWLLPASVAGAVASAQSRRLGERWQARSRGTSSDRSPQPARDADGLPMPV